MNTAADLGLPPRFWAKVQKTDGCWLWTGGKRGGRGGGKYGTFWLDGRHQAAHRLVYERIHGAIPADLLVCHTCDNPPCVRPDHLFTGTDADNVHDMQAKGRARGPAGELHGLALLTEDDVRAIKRERAAGRRVVDIAAERGLHRNTVSSVCRGVRWRHVV